MPALRPGRTPNKLRLSSGRLASRRPLGPMLTTKNLSLVGVGFAVSAGRLDPTDRRTVGNVIIRRIEPRALHVGTTTTTAAAPLLVNLPVQPYGVFKDRAHLLPRRSNFYRLVNSDVLHACVCNLQRSKNKMVHSQCIFNSRESHVSVMKVILYVKAEMCLRFDELEINTT